MMLLQSFTKKMAAMLLLIFATFHSFAVTPNHNGGLTAKAHYLGIQDGQLVFSVNFAREEVSNKQVAITVLANGEYEIFENQYKVNKGQVLFKIDKADIKDISFTISGHGKQFYYRFEVNASYKEEIKVQEIK